MVGSATTVPKYCCDASASGKIGQREALPVASVAVT